MRDDWNVFVMYGNSAFSIVFLAMGNEIDIVRYSVCQFCGLCLVLGWG